MTNVCDLAIQHIYDEMPDLACEALTKVMDTKRSLCAESAQRETDSNNLMDTLDIAQR